MNFTFSPTDPCYRLTKHIMSFLGLPFRRNAGIWRVFCAQLLYRYEEMKMGIVHIKREVLFHTAHSINPWRGLRRRLLSGHLFLFGTCGSIPGSASLVSPHLRLTP